MIFTPNYNILKIVIILKGEINMRLIVDAFGGDNAPEQIVKGCVLAVKDIDCEICLVGREDVIKAELAKYDFPQEKISIHHADEVIGGCEVPTTAIREKKNSSLVEGLNLLKNGEGDGFITAGNTGAYLAGAFRYLGRIKGIKRPALTTVMPTADGFCIVLDVGANADCKPEFLHQFAIMGAIYSEHVLGVKNPRVGLINIGAEESKGNELSKAAFNLLKEEKSINFIGNIEARQVPAGDADVIVCDGFTGNVVLKLTEGVAMTFYGMIKKVFMKNIFTKLSAMLVKGGLSEFKKKMDYTEYGGAPLLGIDGVAIKAHGSSNAKAIYSAVKSAIKFIDAQINSKITEKIVEENKN